MAGESADAVAQAQLERARRLHESARRFQQGAVGERATATALEALPAGWVVLHDLAWPGRQRANIDHVVVGPPGVVVVDSKNWSGRMELDDGVLRQGGRDRSTAVWGVETAAHALADSLPFLPRAEVHAALCFTGQGALTGFVGSVLVVSDTELVSALLARPAVLNPRQVWVHAESIRSAVGGALEPRRPAAVVPTPLTSRASPSRPTPGPRSRQVVTDRARSTRRRRTDWRLVGAGLIAAGLMLQPQLMVGAAQSVGGFIAGTMLSDFELETGTDPRPPVADEPTTRGAREARQERRERRERRQAREAARAQVAG